MNRLEELTPIIEEKLRFMRLFLHEIKYFRAGKRGVLRVFIDKPGGVTIEDCEQVSNSLSVLLDVENFSDQPYTLEVSSPGLDRLLTKEQHFKMVIGHHLCLIVKDGPEKQTEYIGKLSACEHGAVTLEMDDDQTKVFPLSEVISGRVDVRFQ
ncbi:MAG TPA: ribosome maturation factor RimP [Chitinivibrionales bacterium]